MKFYLLSSTCTASDLERITISTIEIVCIVRNRLQQFKISKSLRGVIKNILLLQTKLFSFIESLYI